MKSRLTLFTLGAFLAAKAFSQGYTQSPAFRAAAAARVAASIVVTNVYLNYLQGTNGGGMSYAGLTNAGSEFNGLGPLSGAWFFKSSIFGSATNIDTSTCGRWLFTNEPALPPPPYTKWAVNSFAGIQGGVGLNSVVRYCHQTNANPAYPTETWSILQMNLAKNATNTVATIDFRTTLTSALTGDSTPYDILATVKNTGSAISVNLRPGISGTTNFWVLGELSGINGPAIAGLQTNHWYRAILICTNSYGGVRLLDLENNCAIMGDSFVTSGGTVTPGAVSGYQIGQSGHAAHVDITARSYTYFANFTVATNLTDFPVQYVRQWEPGYQEYVRAWAPIVNPELDRPKRRRLAQSSDMVLYLQASRTWLPGEPVLIESLQ